MVVGRKTSFMVKVKFRSPVPMFLMVRFFDVFEIVAVGVGGLGVEKLVELPSTKNILKGLTQRSITRS